MRLLHWACTAAAQSAVNARPDEVTLGSGLVERRMPNVTNASATTTTTAAGTQTCSQPEAGVRLPKTIC